MQLHWRNEISHFLNQEGVLFVLLSEVKGSIKASNYYPISSIPLSGIGNAKGKKIIVVDTLFKTLYYSVQSVMSYEIFLNLEITPTFITPKKDKLLGGYYKEGNGVVVLLPHVNFEPLSNFDSSTGNSLWGSNAKKIGQTFIDEIVKISKHLKSGSEKTPAPE